MRNFQFNEGQALEDQRIETVIKQRKKKLRTQQTIFFVLLLFILAGFSYYVFNKVAYTDFDGYVQTDYRHFRAKDDINLYKMYKKVGDIVVPGDTLYSYMFLDNILASYRLYNEPQVVTGNRNIRLQTGLSAQDADVLRVKIAELRKQIAVEDHNIQFGLTDNSHKLDLQRQLAETEAQLRSELGKLSVYHSIGRETAAALRNSGASYKYNREDIDKAMEIEEGSVHYVLAPDTAVITQVFFHGNEPVFRSETIIRAQSMNLRSNSMKVVAYVPTEAMRKLNNHTKADIIVNRDVHFSAHVKLLGARTEELPEELRNSLSHIYTTVMVVFEPDSGQVLPFWAAVDRVPVVVRINNYDAENKNNKDDVWYINSVGLTEDSRKNIERTHKKNKNGR
jgi:hypothetical protein